MRVFVVILGHNINNRGYVKSESRPKKTNV